MLAVRVNHVLFLLSCALLDLIQFLYHMLQKFNFRSPVGLILDIGVCVGVFARLLGRSQITVVIGRVAEGDVSAVDCFRGFGDNLLDDLEVD